MKCKHDRLVKHTVTLLSSHCPPLCMAWLGLACSQELGRKERARKQGASERGSQAGRSEGGKSALSRRSTAK